MRNIRLEVLRRVTAFLLVFFIAGIGFGLSGCSSKKDNQAGTVGSAEVQSTAVADDMASLVYQGEPYVVINDNNPAFNDADFTTISFESYGELDELGRCTTAFANIGKDIMPTEKRGAIGEVKPTGWQTAKYDSVDGKYLYNRCHLIGYQLTGENANEKNLITGTRYLNVDGMLPFENMVADYIKETGNHVLYRVTYFLAIILLPAVCRWRLSQLRIMVMEFFSMCIVLMHSRELLLIMQQVTAI